MECVYREFCQWGEHCGEEGGYLCPAYKALHPDIAEAEREAKRMKAKKRGAGSMEQGATG